MQDIVNSHQIGESVQNILTKYPEASLKDIYKSFFQDEYGPGHLLNCVDAPRRLFLSELSRTKSQGRYSIEPCGTGQNFYKVNLDLIVDGFITENLFFQAFIESASAIQSPENYTWIKKWWTIEINIQPFKHLIREYDISRQVLIKKLNQGKVVVHHSKKFLKLYDPHYRIIHKNIIEKYFKGKLPDVPTYKEA
ncbi:MAG: hypothetical protein ACOCYO_08770 [Bacteroidota bacterium]